VPEIAPGSDPADWCRRRLGSSALRVEMLPPRRHSFTHFALEIAIAEIRLTEPNPGVADGAGECWATADSVSALGLPAPVRSIIQAAMHRSLTGHRTGNPESIPP
jgi:A/G-specific adenine glycosylase